MFALRAGVVDAVSGGGGLIQLPALFLLLPAPTATSIADVLGTNKLSSICGTGVAVVQYTRRVPLRWRVLLPAGGAALVFSFLGAHTVTQLAVAWVKPLVFGLLVVVSIHTFVRRDWGNLHAPRLAPRREGWCGLGLGMAIVFYDGFFGPGTGSFLIFALIGLFGLDFLSASANAKVINFATNLSAVAYFAASGHILFGYALPMAACNMAGSLLGARLAILRGNRFVRRLFLGVVVLLILRLGWEMAGKS